MQNQSLPNSDTAELSASIEHALSQRAVPFDPGQVQRLLKHLRRLEPAAQSALAAGVSDGPDFAACLREQGGLP